jgi:hypothetical protein
MEISLSDYVYFYFPSQFPVERYSVAISTIYTDVNAIYPNHRIIASSLPSFQNAIVQPLTYINDPGTPAILQVAIPRLVLDKSIGDGTTGSKILLLPNSSAYGYPAIKGRLILKKSYAVPPLQSTGFDEDGYLHFINDW